MCWISIGQAAGLAVERLADARDRRRVLCGRELDPAVTGTESGGEAGYRIEQIRLLIVSDIVLDGEERSDMRRG